MQQFQNILVGIDLSNGDRLADIDLTPPNTHALRRAIWLAGHTRGRLTIFSTLDVSAHAQAIIEQDAGFKRDVVGQAAQCLERLVAQAKTEGVEATHKLAFGSPWHEISREAINARHDLVVVGTRDLGRAGRILFGSTAMRLLRSCPTPVWVTRPDPNWDDLNVLVPSDLSDVSQDALRIAVDAGQLVDTRLHVLHAVECAGPPGWFGQAQKQMVADYRAGQRAEAERKLHEQLALTDYRTVKHGVQIHVVDGPPEDAILKAVDEFKIDLVVMATSARSGISGLLIGNTAERLISHLTCSVLAVKPADFKSPVLADA